jgi:FMN phosphatase YigB (HAD superfamily)
MTIRTVVLDFDGTCTDVEREGQGFLAAYKRDLASMLGQPDIEDAWAEQERAVLSDPSRHGMVIGGRMVAPPVDLYLLATSVGTLVAPHLSDADTERLFKDNYRYTETAFKDGTKEAVEALAAADVNFYVVTNSEPTTVGAKLDQLAPAGRERIRLHGNARKFLVTEPEVHRGSPRFDVLPEAIRVDAWDRPVFVRRGHYFDALESIWQETGTTPAETLVIGDVFELDLALPGALGCRTHLVPSPRSLDYERRGVEAQGGTHDADLRAVLRHLDS